MAHGSPTLCRQGEHGSSPSQATMEVVMRRMCALLVTALAATILLPSAAPATARTFFGFGLGFGFPLGYPYPAYPYYYAPPAYYYPPYYYPPAPPPSYYVPYAYAQPAARLRCYAGAYSCPLEPPGQIGDACSCSTPRGQAWGRAGN